MIMGNKDVIEYNDKGQRHGIREIYWINGNIWFKCTYHNGILIGYKEEYNRGHNTFLGIQNQNTEITTKLFYIK